MITVKTKEQKQTMLNTMLTPKQQMVLRQELFDPNWTLMINYGAVRAGKTIVNNHSFLYELRRVHDRAKAAGVKNPLYILAGVSSKTIWNNILNPLENDFGIQIKPDKHNSFKLYGVTIVQAYTGSIAGLGAIRGMTAWGAYVNEASMANEEVFVEIRQRCSAPGARVVSDTNPDVPTHWLNAKYIKKAETSEEIVANHFRLDDNTFLTPKYIKSLKETTPSGMFYDRSILGLWVSGEGAVYRDFNANAMLRDSITLPVNSTIYCGVDWGYEHKGSIVVLADDQFGNTYLIEEHTYQHQEIDFWVDIAKQIQSKYGRNVPFFCDTARTEHIARFIREDINAIYGNKAVLSGIEEVAKQIKTGHFFVAKNKIMEFLNEVYEYVWDEKTGMPVKQNDDVMDAIRYAYYTQHHHVAFVTSEKYDF